jgi:transcriptional regulator with XRE-family HTH domain
MLAFGRRLRQLRTWRDLSQEALANRSGMSRDFVARVEQGRTSPGLLRMWELADGLEIGMADFFGEGLPPSWGRQPRFPDHRESR